MADVLTGSIEELAGVGREQLQGALGELPATIPSRPLLGVLPVARVIPQDLHSVMDYAGGLALAVAGQMSRSAAARAAGMALGGSAAATALMTDYRLSLAKLIPIEVHEAL